MFNVKLGKSQPEDRYASLDRNIYVCYPKKFTWQFITRAKIYMYNMDYTCNNNDDNLHSRVSASDFRDHLTFTA